MKCGRKDFWSKKKIIIALTNFILENDYLPNVRQLDKNVELPNHASVSKWFGMSYTEVIKKYFPEYYNRTPSRVYSRFSKEQIEELFLKEYKRIGTPTMTEYNKQRTPHTPCIAHILKILGKTYNELLYDNKLLIQGDNVHSKRTRDDNVRKLGVNDFDFNDLDDEIKDMFYRVLNE